MKFLKGLLVCAALTGSAPWLSAQVTLNMPQSTLGAVIKSIQSQGTYEFFCDDNLAKIKTPAVKVNNQPIEEVLAKVLAGKDVSYTVNDKIVYLKKNNAEAKSAKQQAPTNGKKAVSGQILDENGLPLIGATVIDKKTGNGIATDIDGNFVLQTPSDDVELLVSFVGYVPQRLKARAGKPMTIKLKEDTEQLDEVVVVAYGTQKKSNLTGAVDVVKSKDLENRPVTSASALLQGKASSITFSTPSGGNSPGSNPTLQIRGQAALSTTTPPLVIIDGIPSDMGAFNALNPYDIESISVLKDAAASAVYGARAPYGVLVVSTKMGKKGEKPSVTYSGNYAISSATRMPKTIDSYSFAVMRNQAYLNSRMQPIYDDDEVALIKDNLDNPGKYTDADLVKIEGNIWGTSYGNTDWMDVFLKSSFRHQHDLTLKGGSEKTTYSISAGYVYQPGILKFIEDIDNYTRFNVNANVSTQVNDWLKVTYRSRYSYEETKAPAGAYGGGRSRMFDYIYGAWPTFLLYNPDGTLCETVKSNVESGSSRTMGHRIDQILAFDLKLAKGWTAHIDGTWRMNFSDAQTLRMPVYCTYPSGDEYLANGTESVISKSTANNRYWTIQGYTAYELKLKEHAFRLQLGAQAEENTYRYLGGNAKNLFIYDMDSAHIAQGTRTFDDSLSDWATAGFFGRFNYNWKERYFVEANGRYDGSGRYSRGKRWGFFPSVFGAWNISNEPFWEGLKSTVNYLRVKVSYGTLGNQGNSAGYLHVPTMSVGTQGGWIINGVRPTYVSTPVILNMERTWEKITTLDLGVETRLLQNRLAFEFGYYKRRSWDIIGPPTPLPVVLGASAPNINNAEFETKGIEMQISWHDKIDRHWDYSVSLNLADGVSEITKYNTTSNSISGWYVGKKFGEIWGYTSNRLINERDFDENGKLLVSQSKINANWFKGDVKYEDLNGDGIISPGASTVEDSGDRKIIGNSTPRFRYGIDLAAGYEFDHAGRLDLGLFFSGIAKRDLFMSGSFYYWGTGFNTSSRAHSIYNTDEHRDFYRDETCNQALLDLLGENKNAYFPRPYESTEGNKNFQTSTRYLISGAYLRLKNVKLTYTLPKAWAKKAGMNSCRLYFSGENLWVWSHLPKYIDPESVSNGRMYPQQATYSMGVNVSF